MSLRVCVYVGACVYTLAHVHTRPLFTAAANAVYVGHCFPWLLSLKIFFFLVFTARPGGQRCQVTPYVINVLLLLLLVGGAIAK